MGALLIPSRRALQPRSIGRIDTSSPLARGLFWLTVPHLKWDWVGNRPMTSIGATAQYGGPPGQSLFTNGGSVYVRQSFNQVVTPAWTLFALVSAAAPGSGSLRIVSLGSLGSGNGIAQIMCGATDKSKVSVWMRDDNNNQPTAADSTATAFDSTPHMVHIVSDYIAGTGQTCKCYIDGKFDKSLAANGGNFTFNTAAIGCLYFGGATAAFMAGNTFLAGAANRTWSADEIRDHAALPFQLFAQPRRSIYLDTAAAGGGFNPAWAVAANTVIQPGAIQA